MYELRELQKEDILAINNWRKNIELIECLGAPFRYINLDVEYKWYENYLNNRQSNIRCAVVESNKKEIIKGLVSLTNINFINQSAVFHIMIGDDENRGKGIGYFATTELLNHAFNDINLNRIELTVLETNTRAIRLYERVGFKIEGTKRNSVYKNGEFVNMILMGILKEEYLK
ncbi:GNAT family N-acetyltransferase [Salisediminibacterium beveridgei]|uniref:Spermidine N(1)-acetyltransferase n=1 Tax=Salisediminibacterium beveridgei TaxID=632773 RepID=A0A1D7QRP7_9BACI|nr:GNAT family protein [Salisediminibacterium beveridgei]AOM81669.1 Spermidine N(1)-acetyltransferase [Salisediminibacterium beveridgei]